MIITETTTVKDLISQPAIKKRLQKSVNNALPNCPIAKIYTDLEDKSLIEIKDYLLNNHPTVSITVLVFIKDQLPESLITELLHHIASDSKIRDKALVRCNRWTTEELKILNG